MAHRTALLLTVATFFLSACKDKAEPDYAKCVQADTAGDLQGAVDSCTAALAAEPTSVSGKAAAEKLLTLKVKTNLASTRSTLSDTQSKLEAANAEIATLKETAQYHFEQAIKPAELNTDEGDQAAVDALQAVVDRYPADPLVGAAKDKMKEYRGRIAKRAADLRAAQAQVRNLIATCRNATVTAKGVHDSSLHFDMFQQLDMNSAMAGSQQAAVYEKQAAAAKQKATDLLKNVPDPAGTLAAALDKCDSTD